MQSFATVKLNGELDAYANFQTFTSSFMLLIRCSTGEGWNELMYAAAKQPGILFDCAHEPTYEDIQANDGEPNGCGVPFAVAYFTSFILIVAFVFLNIFIAVILQGF
jgi:hypothetical protein